MSAGDHLYLILLNFKKKKKNHLQLKKAQLSFPEAILD